MATTGDVVGRLLVQIQVGLIDARLFPTCRNASRR